MKRIQKVLRDAGVGSLRKIEQMIIDKRVKVNDSTAILGQKVNEIDKLFVDGKIVLLNENNEKVVYLVNKPRGYSCTNYDPFADKYVTDLVPNGKNLIIAGRLDKDSEGLVILTNDGNLVFELTHPSKMVEKEYRVLLDRELTQKEQDQLTKFVKYRGSTYQFDKIEKIEENTYKILLHHGKKHEIRNAIRAIGANVIRLQRVRIGNYCLSDTKEGSWTKYWTKRVVL